jgi:hypothetical protein
MVLDQMAFFPPGYELKLQIPEVLKKVVIKRCVQNVDDIHLNRMKLTIEEAVEWAPYKQTKSLD